MAEDSEAAPGELVIMYWRDIPAQLFAKAGRVKARRELTPRFQAAIDAAGRAAWLAGAGSDDPCKGTVSRRAFARAALAASLI